MHIQKTFKNKKKNLYLISTPIGNLKEINLRAKKILEEEKYILCENKARTRKLLSSLKILTKKKFFIINKKTENNAFFFNLKTNYVLISDSGYPLISDPGYNIVKYFRKKYNIVIVNGSSAIMSALCVSGFDISSFAFYGFLPKTKTKIERKIIQILQKKLVSVVFINPRKINILLCVLFKISETIKISICRELTKIYEEIITGTVDKLLKNSNLQNKKGEFTIVIDKYSKKKSFNEKIEQELRKLIKNNFTIKQILFLLGEKYNIRKNLIYKLYVKEKKK